MRIGINLLYMIPNVVGGTETYARGLLGGLAKLDRENDYVVFVNREGENWDVPVAPNFSRVICSVLAVRQQMRYFFEQCRLPELVKGNSVDVLHSLGYVAPLRLSCPSVVTIHDLNFGAFGEHMPLRRRLSLQFFVKHSVRRAARVVTVSEFSRREIVKAFPLYSNKVVVIHVAPQPIHNAESSRGQHKATCERLGIRVPFILAFSSRSPNKNIPRLLHAFTLMNAQNLLPHQLVLVGHQPSDQVIIALIRELGLEKRILFTGYLEKDAWENVLCNAQALVYPSLYEGFGLPVLEAMQCGVPVVCSDRASLPEVAGGAALLFDPLSVKDMAEKITRLVLDERLQEELKKKGRENVKRFSWENTARATLNVYRSVVGNSGKPISPT